MSDINEFKEASQILQNVDISEIFTSLALAVAKTQAKLDENSIDQLVKLSEYKMGGKSLLELGFVPAFYCLKEANINTYISLKMASKEALDVKVGFNVNYSTGNNLDKSQTEAINSKKDEKGVDDYKSGKTISFLADESNKIKIENKDVVFNPKKEDKFKDCIAMVEEYEDSMTSIDAVTEVRTTITMDEQKIKCSPDLNVCDTGSVYLCISFPEKFANENFTVLKITDKTGEKLGDLFDVSAEKFGDTLQNVAKSAKVDGAYAFSRDGKYYEFDGTGDKQTIKPLIDLSINFKNNPKEKNCDRLIWEKSLGTTTKKNDLTLVDCYRKLANLLTSTGESITVTGTTAESNETYIKKLGERRAKVIANFLKGLSIKKVDTKSEIDKEANDKAKIILSGDYIVFDKKSATLPTGDKRILGTGKNSVTGAAQINNEDIPKQSKLSEVKSFIESNAKLKDKYLFEFQADEKLLYLLNKKALLSFQLLSKTSDNIKIEQEKSDGKESKICITEDFSTSSKLKAESPEQKDSKSTFAIGASIDVRYSRQFEMSMEGNAFMSAKMISIPPPDEFKAFVLSQIK